MMRRCGVKRLPVVDDEGHAVGIVSRGDLLAVFTRRDEDIRDEIVDDVIARTLLLDPALRTGRTTATSRRRRGRGCHSSGGPF
jgi:CBS domain-containing protein